MSNDRWVVAKEQAVDVGEKRPVLGYTTIVSWPIFDSAVKPMRSLEQRIFR